MLRRRNLEITAELVKTLRNKTDAGMMDCKKALKETGGDLEAAVAYLRQKGLAVASKRADRATSEGAVWAAIAPDQKSGLMLEVNCETDFVAKTPAFVELGDRLAEHLTAVALESVDELLTQPCKHQPNLSVTDYLNEVIAKTGESIRIRHFTRYQGDLVVSYIHHGGKIGVMLELSGGGTAPEAQAAARDLAMQVAATTPAAVAREEISPDLIAKEKAIYEAQAQESGKPANIIEKMVTGRLEKFYKEVCLVEQTFVKNPDITVTQFLKEVGQALGGKDLKVKRFTRYQVGA
jgi:elongation factor Ts